MSEIIPLGKLGRPKGVHGQIRLYSYSRSPEQMLTYSGWHIQDKAGQWQPVRYSKAEVSNNEVLIVSFDGIKDRTAASELTNREVGIPKSELPELAEGDYYWVQLVGLNVINQHQHHLGQVIDLMETGANDVLVIAKEADSKKQLLIPFVPDITIKEVSLVKQTIVVDWEDEDE